MNINRIYREVRRMAYFWIPAFAGMTIGVGHLQAGQKTSAALTLIEASGARAAALGEAFSAVTNDITAMGYNPASLSSLKPGHASFLYGKGIVEDTYGQFMIGSPLGIGFSLAYYDGGSTDLYDGVNPSNLVTVQRDLSLNAGYGHQFGRMSLGLTGKYFSSELAETAKAQSYAADLGLQMALSSHLTFGAAVQNLGTKLQYVQEKESTPAVARAGFMLALFPRQHGVSLFMDGIYRFQEKSLDPAIGVESFVGPLALRAGYKQGSDLEQFSVGTGILLGKFSFDYSFGLVDDLDSRHRVSLAVRYGGESTTGVLAPLSKVPADRSNNDSSTPFQVMADQSSSVTQRVYLVGPGDTLAKIAERFYGDSREWKRILAANEEIRVTGSLKVGDTIHLP